IGRGWHIKQTSKWEIEFASSICSASKIIIFFRASCGFVKRVARFLRASSVSSRHQRASDEKVTLGGPSKESSSTSRTDDKKFVARASLVGNLPRIALERRAFSCVSTVVGPM